jgi:hypothetical protein
MDEGKSLQPGSNYDLCFNTLGKDVTNIISEFMPQTTIYFNKMIYKSVISEYKDKAQRYKFIPLVRFNLDHLDHYNVRPSLIKIFK